MIKYLKNNIFNKSYIFFSVMIIILVLLSFDYFLLFHSLVELFSVITAAIIFIIAVYSHSKSKNRFLIILGIAYGFIGGFDLLHILTYEGMGIFQNNSANLPTQLWIIARYMESISIVVSLLFINKIKKYDFKKIVYSYGFISGLILLALYFGFFPSAYVKGEGLTLFKIISEYIISGILIYGLFLLYKNRDYFKKNIYNLIFVSIILTILSEISFTFYIDVYGISNITGHVFKLLSVILIFKGIVETGFKNPYDLLFRKLEIKNKELDKQKRKLQKQKDFLSITLNSIGDGLIITNEDGNIERINKEAEELTKWSSEEAEGKYISEVFNIINYKTREKVENPVKKVIETKKIVGLGNHTKLIAKDGTEYHISDSAAPIKDNSENIYGVVLVFRNVTKEYKMREKLEKREKKYRQLVEKSPIGIFRTTSTGKIKMINFSMAEILGFDNIEEVYNHYGDLGNDLYVDDNRRKVFIKKLIKNGEVKDFSYRAYDKNNKIIWIEMNARICNEKEEEFIIEGFSMDITERRKYEEKITYISFHDELTGLYNRLYMEDTMERIDTKRNLPISIIMADLNNLKLINDSQGHSKGDDLIKKAAEIIKKYCRQEDVVARWGGDEFVILLPNTTKKESEKIIKRITKNKMKDGEDISVSLAIGAASKTQINEDIFEVLNKAEDNMYTNKFANRESGRSIVLSSFLSTLKEKSYETESHVNRMSDMSKKFGKRLDLSQENLDKLLMLSLLHDIGKISIPERILNKTGSLTNEEWEIIKSHPEAGYRILESIPRFSHIAEAVLHHHESWNGTGYPEGLSGEEIPYLSRIISIIDAYDVMTNDRPYSAAMSVSEALKEIENCSGSQFDPKLAKEFITLKENDK